MLLKGSEAGVLDDTQQEQLSFKLGKLQEAKDVGVQFDDAQGANFADAVRQGLLQLVEKAQTRAQEIRQEQDEAGLIQPPAQPLFDAIPESVSDFIAKETLPIVGAIGAEAVARKFPIFKAGKKALTIGKRLANLGARGTAAGVGGVAGRLGEAGLSGRTPSALELTIEGLTGFIGEPIADAVKFGTAPARAIFGMIKKSVIPQAAEVNALLAPFGQKLLNSQATTSGLLDLFQNVWEQSLTTSGAASDILRNQSQALNTGIEAMVEGLTKGTGKVDTGEVFVSALAHKTEMGRIAGNQLYKNIDVLVNNSPIVSLTPIRGVANKFPRVKALFNKVLRNAGIDSKPVTTLGADALPVTSERVGFAQAAAVRSDFLAEIRAFKTKGGSLGTKESRAIGLIEAEIDNQMKVAAQGAGVLDEWDLANEGWKKFKDTFGNKFIRQLIKSDDALLIGEKLGKLKTPKQIRLIKKAIGDTGTFRLIKGAYVSDIIQKSTKITAGLEDAFSGEIRGVKLLSELLKRDKSVLNEMLGKDTVKRLKSFAQALALVQEKQGKGIGSVATSLMQVGGAGGIIAGVGTGTVKPIATGTMILMAPFPIGRMLQSDTGAKILLEGLEATPGRAKAAALLTKIGLFLANDAFIDTRTKTRNPRLANIESREGR